MIHVVVGTKAQLIKMAPVMWALRDERLPYRLIITGQHAETMDAMFSDFQIRAPDVVLHRGADVVSLPQMFGWALRLSVLAARQRSTVFAGDRAGVVLVHGDAFSALVGALMGRVAGLTVAHVESGLRSFKLFDPFPEELTRMAVCRLSRILFCPGAQAVDHVQRLRRKEVVDTGSNTMRDVLRAATTWAPRITIPHEPFAICTLHRYENIFRRDRFAHLVNLVCRAADGIRVLFVLHPPTARNLDRFGLREPLERHPNVSLRPRYPYFDFVHLLARARFVMTDGGSNQEEASYLGLPCLILRTTTERMEGIGENAVVSNLNPDTVEGFVADPERYRRPPALSGESPSTVIARTLRRYAG